MVDLIREYAGVDIQPSMTVEDARAVLDGLGLPYEERWGAGRLTHEVYDVLVEPKIVRPTFVLDHPRDTSPLARAHRHDPTLVERFEVVVDGSELANAYSELNDPDRSARTLRSRGAGACRRRPRGRHRRRGLPAGARVRAAAHRRHGTRDRPPGHAPRRRHLHPRSGAVPDVAPGAVANRRLNQHIRFAAPFGQALTSCSLTSQSRRAAASSWAASLGETGAHFTQ